MKIWKYFAKYSNVKRRYYVAEEVFWLGQFVAEGTSFIGLLLDSWPSSGMESWQPNILSATYYSIVLVQVLMTFTQQFRYFNQNENMKFVRCRQMDDYVRHLF